MKKTYDLENILCLIGSKFRPSLIGVNCSPSNCANAIEVSRTLNSNAVQTVKQHFVPVAMITLTSKMPLDWAIRFLALGKCIFFQFA